MEEETIGINEFMEKFVSVLKDKFSEMERSLASMRTDINRIKIDINDTKDDLSALESRVRTELSLVRERLETEQLDTKISKDILDSL